MHYILQLESINEDMELLADILSLPVKSKQAQDQHSTPGFLMPKVNPSRCNSYEHFMHQLSSLELDMIYTAFYRDFQLFNYKPFDE